MSRPHIDNLSIWDCTNMEISRDLDHGCLDIICRGEDSFERLRITVWSGGGEKTLPVVKIDKKLFDTPADLDVEALVEGLNHATTESA